LLPHRARAIQPDHAIVRQLDMAHALVVDMEGVDRLLHVRLDCDVIAVETVTAAILPRATAETLRQDDDDHAPEPMQRISEQALSEDEQRFFDGVHSA